MRGRLFKVGAGDGWTYTPLFRSDFCGSLKQAQAPAACGVQAMHLYTCEYER